jgi:catechol 2,3-dioxygenase-like lactoylglutathione lyase family enzyme
MKTNPLTLVVAIAAVLFAGLAILSAQPTAPQTSPATRSDYPHQGMVPQKRILHVGIVVRDIGKAREQWMKLLGLEKAPGISIAAGDPKNPTEFRGHPSVAQAKLVFITLDNLQIELIEPTGDAPSHWREFLERKGEGVHHLAFEVKGMGEGYLENYRKAGYPVVQHGGWETGEYGYMDTAAALGVTLELIERYNRP